MVQRQVRRYTKGPSLYLVREDAAVFQINIANGQTAELSLSFKKTSRAPNFYRSLIVDQLGRNVSDSSRIETTADRFLPQDSIAFSDPNAVAQRNSNLSRSIKETPLDSEADITPDLMKSLILCSDDNISIVSLPSLVETASRRVPNRPMSCSVLHHPSGSPSFLPSCHSLLSFPISFIHSLLNRKQRLGGVHRDGRRRILFVV